MAEEKRITISRTLNGKIIYFIARNSTGKIIARELTQEKLEIAIKTYREPPPVEEPSFAKATAGKEETPVKAASAESSGEPKKKFLTNKLAEKVRKRKKQAASAESHSTLRAKPSGSDSKSSGEPKEEKSQKKKSFWDKLK